MDPGVDDELITILKDSSISVEARSQGWGYIISLSATDDGLNHIINCGKYIPFILTYVLQENNNELKKLAFKSLINISTQEQGILAIVRSRKDICNYLLNALCDEDLKFVQYKCYLLANMSTSIEVIKQIIDIFLSSKGLFQKLVTVYFSREMKLQSQYDFLTLLFANVSRMSSGRRLFLQDIEFISNISKCIKASEPESRRLGAALIFRNCCLETDYHERLLNNVGILPTLLLPLMVPQQYEEGGEMGKLPQELQQQCLTEVKEREQSVSVRRVLVEALTILCYSENGWRFLKSNGTYYVVRDLHTWETDQISKEAIEQLVAYFLIVEYSKPTLNASYLNQDTELIKQLESDMTKDLPDFVIKGGLESDDS